MKYLSFRRPGGGSGWGIASGDGVVDLSLRYPDMPDLCDVLTHGRLDQMASASGAAVDYRMDEISFLPPIPRPDKILGVGINYAAHRAETGRAASSAPSIFSRFADTLTAHDDIILRPRVSTHLDFEGELAIIIGKRGRYIPVEEALSYVAGYSCFNDGSIRDYQKHSVTVGKNFPRTGSLGPYLVTDVRDPGQLHLQTRLNGTVVQDARTDMLIYPVAEIIAFASQFTELSPGTVIATGTPEGVGSRREPPLWMKAGDVVEVEISEIGILRNRVEDEHV
jgi:2-keto-4-pentenoate hydratase/2-oxohepta-3-ene-1,7-dioic acid hydratase in catechol pathway